MGNGLPNIQKVALHVCRTDFVLDVEWGLSDRTESGFVYMYKGASCYMWKEAPCNYRRWFSEKLENLNVIWGIPVAPTDIARQHAFHCMGGATVPPTMPEISPMEDFSL